MEWRSEGEVEWLEARLPSARVAFSTRVGGVSEAPFDSLNLGYLTDDERDAVIENRRRLASALGRDPGRVLIGRQVHGSELAVHLEPQSPSPFDSPGVAVAEVDGQVATEAGLAPLVFIADCLPVALAGPGGVAMLHCGWRGLAAGIVARGVEAVAATDAAIGPGIGPCCYEVGGDVLATFSALGFDAPGPDPRPDRDRAPNAGRRRGRADRGGRDLHELRGGAVLLPSPRCRREPGARRASSGSRRTEMPGLIEGIEVERVAANLERAREVAGEGVELLAATKYVRVEEMGVLAEAGVTLVGENRLQDLAAKRERWGDAFSWDFIGNLQSRKVKQLLPICRLIHSVATDSALEQLGRHGTPETEVLVEVNVAGEEGKAGIAPAELGAFIERCPVRVSGLMTMPPFSQDPEASRPHFARLAELAAEHGLERLSMGTSQDWEVAVAEGATIVRLGTVLYM